MDAYRAADGDGKRLIRRLLEASAAEKSKRDTPLIDAILALNAIPTRMSEAQYLRKIHEALDRFAPERS